MQRRGFLQAIGAGFGLAFIDGVSLLALKPSAMFDLESFCSDDPWYTRYNLQRPFSYDGLTYATDARILVRTNLVAPSGDDPARKLPDLRPLPWETSDPWRQWPKPRLVRSELDYNMCPRCLDVGLIGDDVRTCATCKGLGEVGEYGRTCPSCCNGYVGGTVCDLCQGKCCVDRHVPCLQPVGESFVSPKYDAKIRGLEGVEYAHTSH